MSLPPADIPWQALEIAPKGLRLGLMLAAGFGAAVTPEVKAVIEAAARIFAAEGAEIVAMPPFLTPEMMAGLDIFWRVRAWADIGALPPARAAKVLPFIRAWAEGGAGASGREVLDGVSQIMAMRAAAARAFQGVDFVLAPTAPMPAFAAELPSPNNDPKRPFEHIGFTVGANMSEQPAVSINAGYSEDGLPIGLQIIGQRFDDIGVLRVAALWEKLRPAQRPWPEA
jgi:aspartyl-tRNA(Asn)/glutamyl-tRNA(Gln) amidotransferase subunit A